MPQCKYIGPTQTFKGGDLNPSNINSFPEIKLIHDTSYEIDVQQDGPVMVVNGQQVVNPNSTLWVILPQGRIPYSPQLISNHWDIKL